MVSPGNKAKKWSGDFSLVLQRELSSWKHFWRQDTKPSCAQCVHQLQLERSHPDTVPLKRAPNSNFKVWINSLPLLTSHLLFQVNRDCWYWGFNLIFCIEVEVSTVRPLIAFSKTNCYKGLSFGPAFCVPSTLYKVNSFKLCIINQMLS